MVVLKIFLVIYLILGFIYAINILIKGRDRPVWFPINVLLGPLTVLYLLYLTVKGKDVPIDW